jgi:transcriptional regulator with XRE-family HTH domain
MKPVDLKTILERQLLLQLGDRLRQLRMSHGISSTSLAAELGITRNTLRSIESGDPSPSMGNYLRVMSRLGVAGDMALLASDAMQTAPGDTAAGRTRRAAHTVQVKVKVLDDLHQIQDLQSMALHEAAVNHVKQNPHCVTQAQSTLARWRSQGESRTEGLFFEWEKILNLRSWRKILGRSRRAQQLRQASPLVTVLPEDVRKRVLSHIKTLKQGVVMEGPLTHIQKDGVQHEEDRLRAHHTRLR